MRAVLVEPAYTKTKISRNAKSARVTLEVYAAERKRMTDAVQKDIEHGDDPRIVAEAVLEALTAKSPRLRYPVGKGVALSRLRRFVPAGMFDKSFRKQFQLDGHVNTPVRGATRRLRNRSAVITDVTFGVLFTIVAEG